MSEVVVAVAAPIPVQAKRAAAITAMTGMRTMPRVVNPSNTWRVWNRMVGGSFTEGVTRFASQTNTLTTGVLQSWNHATIQLGPQFINIYQFDSVQGNEFCLEYQKNESHDNDCHRI
jgi:hypothetical protein